MERTAEQRLFLASSAEFQRIIAEDSELKELDASRIDYAREGLLLWDALGGFTEICGMDVSPITPAIWSNLWLMRHPLATGGEPGFQDVASAVYMLTHSYVDSAAPDFGEKVLKYAESISLMPELAPDVWRELVGMVDLAFSPLQMLPHTSNGAEPIFDADWLLSVCSVVSAEAGIPLREAALSFPLSSAFGLMVIRARKANPSASYGKHTPEWISRATLARIQELGDAFLKEHFTESANPPPARESEPTTAVKESSL